MLGVRVFTLRYDSALDGFDDSALQRFLSDRKLMEASPHFFEQDGLARLAVFVTYRFEESEDEGSTGSKADGGSRPESDLKGPDRELYDTLRDWRRDKSREEGIPAYLVASNRMLVDLVRTCPTTVEGIRSLDGFGPKKVALWGRELLRLLAEGDHGHR